MKKLLSLALALVLCLSLMPAMAESGTEGKTEIVVWNQIFEDWNRAWCEERVAEFNADPNQKYYVTQEFVDGAAWDEKVAAARAAGTMPDVYLQAYNHLVPGVSNEYYLPLNDLIPQEQWDNLYDNVKNMVTVNGQYYAYPQLLEPAVVMYYRKDLLEAAGLSVPKTWDEFAATAKALTTDDMYGATMNYEWSMWGWEYTSGGHWPIADDWSAANCQDEGYVDLLNFIGQLYADESVPLQALEGYNGCARLVCDESVAITFSGSWGISAILTDYPEMADVIGVAPAPTKDGSPFHSTLGGWVYVIDAKTDNAEGAAAYISWLLGEDAARTGSFFEVAKFSKYSPRKSVDEYLTTQTAAASDEWMQIVSSEIVPNGVAEPIYAWDISAHMLTAIGEVVTNGSTAEDALAGAADAINLYIQNNDYASKKPQ